MNLKPSRIWIVRGIALVGLVASSILAAALLLIDRQADHLARVAWEPKTAEQTALLSAEELTDILNQMGEGAQDIFEGLGMAVPVLLTPALVLVVTQILLLFFPYPRREQVQPIRDRRFKA